MKSIGILGQGFVGSAVREGFCNHVQVVVYDRKEPERLRFCGGDCVSSELWNVSYECALRNVLIVVDGPIFLCLPTPMLPDGSCDTSIVENVVLELDATVARLGLCNPQAVVIKSTVPPGTTERLNSKYRNLTIVFNPEFLTEANANKDFATQDRIILGGPPMAMDEVSKLYTMAFPGVPIIRMRSTEAEMVKYVTNCFLAVKVSLANEFEQIADTLSVDYSTIIAAALLDKRLGDSHWNVPGPDGKLGFGGSCFPKDLNGLMAVARENGVSPLVMTAAWMKNLEVRPERDWESLKGRAVV